jgi:hypothetical protein
MKPAQFLRNLPPLREGESWGEYNRARHTEFQEKMEALGEAILEGKTADRKTLWKLARRWKVTVADVRTLMHSEEARLYIEKVTREKALYAVAQAVPDMGILAKSDPVAFARLAEIAELKGSGGVQIQNVVDNRNMGDNESDQRFFERFQERVLKNMQAKMQLVEGEAAIVPEAEAPPDP